jgi:hypothetical protein
LLAVASIRSRFIAQNTSFCQRQLFQYPLYLIRLQEFLREEDVGNGSAPRFERKKNWINHRLLHMIAQMLRLH